MAVYNTAPYLNAALESISGQTFEDLELVAIDDGSSDGSAELLAAYAAREPRMRLIRRANRGLIATRNELLAEARGDLIAWMDSDDVSLPERIARQVKVLDADPQLAAAGTQAMLIDPEGRRLGPENWPFSDGEIRDAQREGGGMRFPSTLMRRLAAVSAGGFRDPFRMGEDLDFLLRLGDRGRLTNLPDMLYLYRQHPTSTCLAFGGAWRAYRDAVLRLADERATTGSDRLQRGEPLEIALEGPTAPSLDEVYASWSERARSFGFRAAAVRYGLKAVRLSPLRKRTWRAVARSLT